MGGGDHITIDYRDYVYLVGGPISPMIWGPHVTREMGPGGGGGAHFTTMISLTWAPYL